MKTPHEINENTRVWLCTARTSESELQELRMTLGEAAVKMGLDPAEVAWALDECEFCSTDEWECRLEEEEDDGKE